MRVQRNESLNGKTWYNVAASLRGSSQSFQLHTFNGSTPVRTRAGNEGAELNELDLTEICQHWWLLCVSGDAPLHTFPSSFSPPCLHLTLNYSFISHLPGSWLLRPVCRCWRRKKNYQRGLSPAHKENVNDSSLYYLWSFQEGLASNFRFKAVGGWSVLLFPHQSYQLQQADRFISLKSQFNNKTTAWHEGESWRQRSVSRADHQMLLSNQRPQSFAEETFKLKYEVWNEALAKVC